MRKHFYCVVVLMMVLAIASCQENKQANIVFERVEGMMDDHPDSALAILDSMRKESESYPRSQKMRYELLCAKAQNKAYVDFTTDSVMKEVVDYYDAHGTANEKVEAHYLLGCTYRDMHEAPMALNCYLDAVECADTLSDDCDYDMLMCVYGQMANLFDDQLLPDEELDALEKYQYCARKCTDIYNEINGVLLMSRPFALRNDSINIYRVFSRAQVLCEKNGFTNLMTMYYPSLIYDYIGKGKYNDAHKLMRLYERDLGMFDSEGNIKEGYEHYYNSKGYYYLGTGKLDSAEFFFRKLRSYGYEYDACKGLCEIFGMRKMTDSLVYYSELFTKATDSEMSEIHTDVMLHVANLYNYSRNEKIASQNIKAAYKNKIIAIAISIAAVIIILSFVEHYRRFKNRKRNELEALNMNFLKVSERYEATKKDLVQIGEDFSGFKKTKEEELSALQQQLAHINSQYNSLKHKDKLDALKNSSAFKAIKNKLDPHQKNNLISDREWDELVLLVIQCLPAFYTRITNDNLLSKQELQVTILTKLGFTSSDIALMLDKAAQSISNAKATSNSKLFGDSSARTFSVNIETL